MSVYGVIPARWGSTRFPGKSLTRLQGKPLIQHVIERAQQAARLDRLIVATDDERIAAAAKAAGADVAMTRPDHPSGTDRMAEALAATDADVAVNIQGDEPLIDPTLIDRLVDTLQSDATWDMATAAARIDNKADLCDPSVVKTVWDQQGRALYFSRAPIPWTRDPQGDQPEGCWHWRHIGIYAYRRSFLDAFVTAAPCAIEGLEKLEQLRALHIGGRIAVLQTHEAGLGVDTPEDARRVERLLASMPGLERHAGRPTPDTQAQTQEMR